jgi:HAD superfamily hydrolase (TIGR01509 family)
LENLKNTHLILSVSAGNVSWYSAPMIKAVIFDMDGLLIDSEPLWQEAEFDEFTKVGVPMTREMCTQTIGLRINEVVDYWFTRYPWENIEHDALEKRIMKRVIELVKEKGNPKAGVHQIIQFMKTQKIRMALASSSFYDIIHAVLTKLQIADSFEVIHSAEDEKHGKPHPAIYLSTAAELGVLPQECIAIEDSLNGVLSAKAARMKCIAVPDSSMHYNEKLIIADMQLQSLADMNDEKWREIMQWFDSAQSSSAPS